MFFIAFIITGRKMKKLDKNPEVSDDFDWSEKEGAIKLKQPETETSLLSDIKDKKTVETASGKSSNVNDLINDILKK